MPKASEMGVWWHGVATLPAQNRSQAYHALRRVWGDHTIAGARSFYRWGSEDNVTPALFQNWAMFPDPNALAPLVRVVGGSVGTISKVRWAYACEEILDARLRLHHGRSFIIPDIILVFEDEHGLGLLVFEVKKPGAPTDAKDSRKLTSYCDLPSVRHIARRVGCLLISAGVVERSLGTCGNTWPVLTWERLAELQIAAVRELALAADVSDLVCQWLLRGFARYGIRVSEGAAPAASAATYGTVEGYRRIDLMAAPKSILAFLKGSECAEAAWRDEQPAPPLPWLSAEPTRDEVRMRKMQTTHDRRVCRWSFGWGPVQERSWE